MVTYYYIMGYRTLFGLLRPPDYVGEASSAPAGSLVTLLIPPVLGESNLAVS